MAKYALLELYNALRCAYLSKYGFQMDFIYALTQMAFTSVVSIAELTIARYNAKACDRFLASPTTVEEHYRQHIRRHRRSSYAR